LVVKGSTTSTGMIIDSSKSELAMTNMKFVDITGSFASKFFLAL
jgi:hypothetical protein